jgi:hypothetical protein
VRLLKNQGEPQYDDAWGFEDWRVSGKTKKLVFVPFAERRRN